MKNLIAVGVLACSTAMLVACGGGGGGGGGTTGPSITGTISGNGYAENNLIDKVINYLLPLAYASNPNSPDNIAVVYDRGNSVKLFPIANDGSFKIDTTNMSGTMVAFVVNATSKKLFCHFKLAANGEMLDGIPKGSLASNLVLGSVDTANDCAASITIDSASAFSATEIQNLKDISRNDDGLALYINKIINDGNIQFYNAIRFEMGAMASVTGAYNTINSGSFKSSYYSGSSPLIYLGSSMRNVTAVSLYPPSAVNYSTDAIFATNPSYGAISDSSNPIVKSGLSFNAAAGVTTVETVAIGNFPSGEWNIFDRSSGSDGAPIGKFYLDGANPFDVNGYFKGLIPKVKITSDQSGNIQDVSVQLFKQLADGTLEQINRGFGTLLSTIVFFLMF